MSIMAITTDKAKAKNLFQNALGFLDTLKLIQVNGDIRSILNLEYDLLHTLTIAVLAYDGVKVGGEDHHRTAIFHISEKYGLREVQAQVFDELRRVRNDINYYGQKSKETLEDFYERNKETITTTRGALLKILQQKLSN